MLVRPERPSGPISKVVGLYHNLLRKTLEHFFPTAILEIEGDRSIIDWDGSPEETHFQFIEDPDQLGLQIVWLGTRLSFRPKIPFRSCRWSGGWSRSAFARSIFVSAASSIRI